MGDLTMCRPASGSSGRRRRSWRARAGLRCGSLRRCRWSRAEQTRQIGQSGRRSLRLVELEPDLQVAAVQIELGNLVFLQEFNQLFQICDVLWFHSFLDLPLLGGGG